jgi:hypothetical protein
MTVRSDRFCGLQDTCHTAMVALALTALPEPEACHKPEGCNMLDDQVEPKGCSLAAIFCSDKAVLSLLCRHFVHLQASNGGQ